MPVTMSSGPGELPPAYYDAMTPLVLRSYVRYQAYVSRSFIHKTLNGKDTNVYGHTTLKTPVLVRSPKLSNVGPG